MQIKEPPRQCTLCGSSCNLTFHHLIPKRCHSNKWFQKRFSRDEMQNRGIILCRKCHYFIHDQFSEKELGRTLNTEEKLRAEDCIARYAQWAAKRRRPVEQSGEKPGTRVTGVHNG